MNGGIVPLLLLSVTLGLFLAFVPWNRAWPGLFAAAIAAAATAVSIPATLVAAEVVFVGLWLSMIVTAVGAHTPVARSGRWAIPAGINAGFWLGAYAVVSGTRHELGFCLAPALLCVPGHWFTSRDLSIAIKVVASWMIAIASLSLFVSLMPTPGYVSDHME